MDKTLTTPCKECGEPLHWHNGTGWVNHYCPPKAQTASKWPWMAVFRVDNGFIVRCGLGGQHASEAEYVFSNASEMGKWIAQHAGAKS